MPDELANSHRGGGKARVDAVGREVAELAARQHGVVSRGQLRDAGLTRRQIETRTDRGLLHGIHEGVYAVGHRRLTQHGSWMAAVLAGGDRSALSHLCGAGNFELTEKFPSVPDITTPRTRHQRPGLSIHVADLADDEIEICNGIPTTSISRTILDVAAVAGRYRAERVIAEAEYRGLVTADSIAKLLERYRGRRGIVAVREIHALRLPSLGVTRSVLEERFLVFLDRNGLPRPELNVQMELAGSLIVVDCLWREQRVIVELDGRAAHMRAAAFESDRARDRRLTVAGWRPTRVTWQHLGDEIELGRDLRALLNPRRTR